MYARIQDQAPFLFFSECSIHLFTLASCLIEPQGGISKERLSLVAEQLEEAVLVSLAWKIGRKSFFFEWMQTTYWRLC